MTDWVYITDHAAERWHERTETPGIGPIVAWNESGRREVSELTGDEIRYHRATETLLIRKGGVLVTVIDASTARPNIQREIYGNARPSLSPQ